jgi:hypothetical protein
MSKVISFSAWKGRKQLVCDTQSRPDVCDGAYPEADEAITFLRIADRGKNGPFGDAADCIEELLGNLYEYENYRGEREGEIFAELEEAQALIAELQAELADCQSVVGG